ncbi:MAG: APC family permease [Thiohalocapsa sp.]|uniref:APC family permease n=1 Tax=Thiohalocapsa sp. TaxID=2497641 RepID=UPI0025EF40A0|nr:APC family permease [Thiohalocapsa sp.]MCG6939743.1 APC family permease [Thiohalocapsa sp.]
MTGNDTSPIRAVGGFGLYFVAVSSMIGSSWLFSAMYSAEYAGPAGILSIAIGGIIILIIALVFAEVGGVLPVTGGSARVPQLTHGDYASFTVALLNWLGYLAVAPLEVMAIIEYASDILPALATSEQGHVSLTRWGILTCIPLLFVLVVINVMGVRALAKTNGPLAVWKLALPVLTIVVFLLVRLEPSNFAAHGGFMPFGWSGVLGAVTSGGAVLGFLGFRSVLELGGEARNPGRTIPLVLAAAMASVIVIYVMLAVAFVGALSPAQLAGGWSALSDKTGAGPFATMALGLGLAWLAMLLFADAAVSPSGTALIYTGVAGRLSRAAAQNGHAPPPVARLNRAGAPAVAIWINFGIGLLLLLPFPGWQTMMTLISSTLVLSLGFGPVCLLALRDQAPDLPRRFRLPAGLPIAALAAVLAAFVVYWGGWKVNRLLLLVVLAGWVVLPFVTRVFAGRWPRPLDIRALFWMAPYFGGLAVVSWLGNYGGRGLITAGVDLLLIALLTLMVLALSFRLRLPPAEARARIENALEQAGR